MSYSPIDWYSYHYPFYRSPRHIFVSLLATTEGGAACLFLEYRTFRRKYNSTVCLGRFHGVDIFQSNNLGRFDSSAKISIYLSLFMQNPYQLIHVHILTFATQNVQIIRLCHPSISLLVLIAKSKTDLLLGGHGRPSIQGEWK